MSKKIVIMPTFCEAHLIKCQIPNIIDTIDPDYIVYNEGVFPNGPESNKKIDSEWLDKYTLDGNRGFDYKQLKEVIYQANKNYSCNIVLNALDYDTNFTATQCYIKATSNFEDLGIKVEEGDYIFPFEGDVFHHEKDKDLIQHYLTQLEPGTGFGSIWVDYLQNFWYTEKSRIKPFLKGGEFHHENNYMTRRICVRYDASGQFYEKVLSNFETSDHHHPVKGYGMLYPTDLITYHYAWIRPGKYRDLRCDQLHRPDGYWNHFKKALDLCDEYKYNEILIRPNKKDLTSGYAKFFNSLEHPAAIRSHELWIDLDEEMQLKLSV